MPFFTRRDDDPNDKYMIVSIKVPLPVNPEVLINHHDNNRFLGTEMKENTAYPVDSGDLDEDSHNSDESEISGK